MALTGGRIGHTSSHARNQKDADNQPPKIVLEVARRGLSHDVRPSQEELEALLKAIDSGG